MIKNFFQKIMSVLIGLISALIILEILLQTAGFVLSSYQKYQNNKILKNKSQYTVMCIGESTTHNQYPLQLQQLLNTKYSDVFTIIDWGLTGTSMQSILASVDGNIQTYRPDIAICMMGINDNLFSGKKDDYMRTVKNNNFYLKLKICRLASLLKKHAACLLNAKNVFAENTAHQTELKQAIALYHSGDYDNSEKILKKILTEDPHNAQAYCYITEIYFYYSIGLEKEGYAMALKAVNSGLQFDRANFYRKIIEYQIKNGNLNLAKQFLNQALAEQDLQWDMLLYDAAKKIITDNQKEQIFQKILINENDMSYAAAALYYIEQKNYEKADKYFNLADDLRLTGSNKDAVKLYKLIVKKLIDNNIKVICMQYPVRSIKPLQTILKDADYYDKITFISNELNFKQALKEKTYNEIFRDQFAGDFGHCTDYGNTLIAENAAKTLTDLTKND